MIIDGLNVDPKALWKSTEAAWGRAVELFSSDGPCMVCGREECPCLDIDTSDGEYMSFTCCSTCFTELASRNAK